MAKPKVAILGASNNRQKYGNMSVRAHLRAGYDVFPVNPNEEEVEGLKCYSDITSVPEELDRISIYLRPQVTIELAEQIATKAPAAEVWLNPGAESPELIDKLRGLGMNVVTACSIVDLGISPAQL